MYGTCDGCGQQRELRPVPDVGHGELDLCEACVSGELTVAVVNVSGIRTEVDYALAQLSRAIYRLEWDAVSRAKDALERAQSLLKPAE